MESHARREVQKYEMGKKTIMLASNNNNHSGIS